MLQRTKYHKSDDYIKYNPNLTTSFQSSKYHHKKNQEQQRKHQILGKRKILQKIGTKKMIKII